MTKPSEPSQTPEPPVRPGLGLSAKLLLLTVGFVLLAEVMIFVPSMANFRLNWLHDRLVSATTAALVIEASPDGMIPRELEKDILTHVGAMMISVKVAGTRRLLAVSDMPPMVSGSYDLREDRPLGAIGDAFATLFAPEGRAIRVIGAPPRQGDFIDVVMIETPLKQAMLAFAANITLLSLAISAITATLVYLALLVMFVRPMRRIHEEMMRFRADPENPASRIVPSARRDEIGRTERELERMQRDLQDTLQHKQRLADLGLAVAKINHDLRNILSSAQLFSDRLSTVQDPTVQRLMPKVLGALDRAVTLCRDTLAYGKAREPAPQRRRVRLAPLVEEVGAIVVPGPDAGVAWHARVDPALEVDADPDQLFRVLLNLARNAADVLSVPREDAAPAEIVVSARREGGVVVIEVADNGPGVPDAIRPTLFRAFSGTTRVGGSGLGLAIAAELVRGHEGTIALAEGTMGATFLITIPDRPIALAARRPPRAAND